MTLHRFLSRHHAELGAPLTICRSRFGLGPVLVAVGIGVLGGALILAATAEGPQGARVAALMVLVAAIGAVLLLMSGEVVVVCEGGLVLGPTGLFRSPFLVRYAQITPGSLVPVHGARKYSRTTGTRGQNSLVRTFDWTERGVHFVGPSGREALREGEHFAGLMRVRERSFDGRWIWFLGTGSTPPEQITAQIAAAAGRAGYTQLADATASAPPRVLTGRREDRARLLPGYGA